MKDEFLDELINALWNNIDFWENQSGTTREKLEGVVFSTLASIDGSGAPFKKFTLVGPDGIKIDEELHSAFHERNPNNEKY